MSQKKGLLSSSILRKVAMALSAVFLMVFLLQHLAINSLSVFSPESFNEVSHFMGTNPLVQFVLQPVLVFAVLFHFVMGFVLEAKNRAARNKYVMYKGAENASWMSRNMIVSGICILSFIALHFVDFWIPEMNTKYVLGDMSGMLEGGSGYRYYEELVHKFHELWRVVFYSICFVFLALHLMHGFSSAFQSIGSRGDIYKIADKIGKIYSIAVPAGFILIAVYHFVAH